MKIIFDKEAFIEKLIPCMSCVVNKNTLNSIEGIMIETMDEKTVRLSSFDLNKGVRVLCDTLEIIEPGSCIINGQKLFQIVRLMPEDEITIDVNEENYNVTIYSGKSSFSLFSLRGSEFPVLPELSGEIGFELTCDVFRRVIGRVINSVAEHDSRPMLCGAFFNIKGNEMEIVSCDSYTLSKCNIICDDIKYVGSERRFFSFILPGHALNELIKIIPDNESKIGIYLTRKHAVIKFEGIIFFTRLIDSEYIDYDRIIPKDQSIFINIDRNELLKSLERAMLVAEEKIQGSGRSYVKLGIRDGYLSITSTSVNGKVYDEILCEKEGEDLEIGFNCKYLTNGIRCANADMLKLSFKTPTQCVIIEPSDENDGDDFFYMVLPVRMNEAR